MVNKDPSLSIDEQAAYWAANMSYRDNRTPQLQAELSAWLEADPRHRGAYMRARAALHVMEQAIIKAPRMEKSATLSSSISGMDEDEHPTCKEPTARRSWNKTRGWNRKTLLASIALAASVTAVVALNMPLFMSMIQSETVSDQQIVALKDGSVATLHRDARIEVALSTSVRRITVLQGEVLFKVAKDKSRPFVVRSGDVYAQATGTVYSVKRLGTYGAVVKVMEGSVLVWPRNARDQAVQIYAGDTVTLDLQPPKVDAKTTLPVISAPPPELAQISLDNVTVSSAVARFNRVNSTQIIIADPEIGDIRIVGLFEASDVDKFSEAVAALSDGTIQHQGNNIVIKMK